MKSIRSKSISIAIAAVLTYSAFSLMGATPAAMAQFSNITFPAGANRSLTRSKAIPGSAQVKAIITLRRNGSNDQFPNKRFHCRLIRPNGTVADTEIRIAGSSNASFSLDSAPAGGTACGNWTVEITNPGDNATGATGTVSINFSPVVTPQKTTYSPFGVSQGSANYVDKTITVPGTGQMVVTATWDTDELTPQHYQLSFRLYRNNTQVASDAGYSQNAPFVSSSQRMRIAYNVTDASGSWKVRVLGSTYGKVKNVRITRVLTPSCP